MKSIRILLVLLAVMSITLSSKSQKWMVQHSELNILSNPSVLFSAVDSNICWGIQYFTLNPSMVRTTDGGDNWILKELTEFSGYQCNSISAIDENTAWVAIDHPTGILPSGIYKTTNGGDDWVKQTSAFPGPGGDAMQVHFFDADNGLCIGMPWNGNWEIYTTTDGGSNWIKVPSANIPPPSSMSDWPLPSGKSVSGNNYWFSTFLGAIYHSTDRGLTWQATSNINGSQYSVLVVAFQDNMNGLSAAYFGPQVNRTCVSTDGGAQWTYIPTAPSRPSAYYLAFAGNSLGTERAYVLTSHFNIGSSAPTLGGSAYTLDGGQTWQQIDSLAHGPASFADNTGWSAGRGDTIFKWKWLATAGIEDDFAANKLNVGVALSQNYPNPFSKSTSIFYRIPESAFVTLKVYDIIGNEVATLVNENISAGTYKVNFETGNLKSGTYFYRIQAGTHMQARKMFVLERTTE